MFFNLTSPYKPTGDQPQAIKSLVAGLNAGQKAQTLVGVTGSGKTFTVVNVIHEVQRPTLIICHNKTLAAQVYAEVRDFFPNNAVEYFVSYYDYYQPEAYIPATNVYIEKDLAINEEIERLRSRTVASLLSGRRDVVVVASVSCIYGLSDPNVLQACLRTFRVGDKIERDHFLLQLVDLLYKRNETNFTRGSFRVRGDQVDVFPIHETYAYRFSFFGDEIEAIHEIDVETGACIANREEAVIFPMNLFVAGKQQLEKAIVGIEKELDQQVMFFLKQGCTEEAERLQERTHLDIDMMREVGYCSGIENYSRFFDGRDPGDPSYTLLDYFPKDCLIVVDESHVTIPQIRGMWGGDHARKKNLVKYGFRIPAAMDNRPLTLDEFQSKINQVIYVSATPADYELTLSEGVVTEQLIRPTWIVDPLVEVHASKNQIDHLFNEVRGCIRKGERVLVMTTTKKFAEELSKYLAKRDVRCRYLHSEIKTLDRVKILEDLRMGSFDVLVGVNLLREGLDLPEVSLVAILDADKEGFLRNFSSLMQMGGRAARHVHGKVLLYADKMTPSLKRFMDETQRRRRKQEAYNKQHGVTPTGVKKGKNEFVATSERNANQYSFGDHESLSVAEAEFAYVNDKDLGKLIKRVEKRIETAAGAMDYVEAQKLQEELGRLQMLQAHRRSKK
ncbi:MAG: excinuclease ABC subunit UvrB [Cytophagales bacterium]